MASNFKTCQDLDRKKLVELYENIAMDIVFNYFESKILGGESFTVFLERNLHKLYHLCDWKPCCISLCEARFKYSSLTKAQFCLLYEKKDEEGCGVVMKNGIKTQCLCIYRQNQSTSPLDLDIGIICTLFTEGCSMHMSLPGHPSDLENIRNVRNTIYHLGNESSRLELDKEALWNKLTESTLNIASTTGDINRELVRRRIDKLKNEYNKLQAFSKAVGDEVYRNIVTNLEGCGIQIDEINFKITKKEVKEEDLEPLGAVGGMDSNMGDVGPGKCYVAWKFKNLSNWNVEYVKEKLNLLSKIIDFNIEFIYEGSIIVVTSTTLKIPDDRNGVSDEIIEKFLRKFVEITQLDTSIYNTVEVEVILLSSKTADRKDESSPEHIKVSEEEVDFLRLVSLVVKVAPKAVRYLFDQRFPPGDLTIILMYNLVMLNRLKNSKVINAAQWDLLFPPSGDATTSTTYDVTLLICLLRNINLPGSLLPAVAQPLTGFDELPQATDSSEGADLARIKHYRNNIVHNKDAKISRKDFDMAWWDLCEAIRRLGAGIYRQDCIELRVASLDGFDRAVYRDMIKTLIDEEVDKIHTDLSTTLADYSSKLAEQTKKTQEITASVSGLKEQMDELDSSVPRYMKVKHGIHIREWEKDEGTYTVTRATEHVANMIDENNVVVVVGSSGAGKSSIIHHVALELHRNEGYDIIPFVTSPTKIKDHRDMKKNQVFVIDDICGKNFIDEQDLQSWKIEADNIETLFHADLVNKQDSGKVMEVDINGRMKLLVSCRLQISKDEKFKSLKMFTKNRVDLESEKHCLLLEEKHKMIKKYIADPKSDLQEMDEMFQKYSYFPLLCKMSKGKQVKQLTELFSSPVESIKNDIKDMIENKHFEFCALVLCVLLPNELDEAYINPRTTPQNVKVKVTKIVANFRINLKIELERKQLVDTFNRLDGTYIKKTGSVYSIAHDKLYDMVAVTCGEKLVELFIEYSPSSFIAERFRLLSGQNLEQDDSFLYLSDDTELVYFDRIFRDLKEQDGKSFFYNQQLKEKRYKDKVMGYIKEHTDSCKQLFHELDYKGVKCNRYNISTPMVEALKIGFYELVKYLISIKCNVNKTDNYGDSPLYYCYENGHVNIVDLLITNGGNIQDILCEACWHGDIDKVRMCLERDVDVSQCNSGLWGQTPLYCACVKGHIDIVRLLLDRNVDVSQCNSGVDGETPLYGACEGGHIDIVRLLLDRNVDVSQFNSGGGETPLYGACVKGHIDIVRLLLDRNVDVSQCNSGRRGETPLYGACYWGHFDIVRLLLDRNVDVSQCNSGRRGETPLYGACYWGHFDIVRLLLDRNVDVSQCNSGVDGETPLYGACEEGHIDIVRLLLDRNVDVSQCNSGRRGETPLYGACYWGHIDIVRLLLDRNVDVSQCNSGGGETPLYGACEGGHIDIVRLLLQNNADPTQRTREGDTPLDAALDESIKQLLRSYIKH